MERREDARKVGKDQSPSTASESVFFFFKSMLEKMFTDEKLEHARRIALLPRVQVSRWMELGARVRQTRITKLMRSHALNVG